jgi:AAA15 family ATPase/GTPase
MLVKFSVENFLSFKEMASINFQPGAIKEYKENVFFPDINRSFPLLKSAGLFGKNASGKSNIIKAISFMRDFVLNSSRESSSADSIKVDKFLLSTETEFSASTFEVVFYLDNEKYRFGFSVTEKFVVSEWLFIVKKNKEEKIFIRAKQEYTFEKDFKNDIKGKLELLTEFTRPNSLFISVLSQFNNDIGKKITQWFNDLIIAQDSAHLNLIEFTARLMSTGDYKKLVNDIVRRSDLGIDSIEERISQAAIKKNFSYDFLISVYNDDERSYNIKTKHVKYNANLGEVDRVTFDLLQNESFGTQKFFGILGPILFALKQRKILWVDEIDARMHSLLFEQVIKIFNSEKFNPNGAQLIFTSHNPFILKKGLRRDQIILVEKNDYGVSTLNSLYQKAPKVRNDASFDKDYLLGKYGAIPRLNSQLNLFEGL